MIVEDPVVVLEVQVLAVVQHLVTGSTPEGGCLWSQPVLIRHLFK